MQNVASEMERLGFALPLLIGGATTSRAHTAVKIAQKYSKGVIHVHDASRAVGVVSSLLNEETRGCFLEENLDLQQNLRNTHADRQTDRSLLSLETARSRKLKTDWSTVDIPMPAFYGKRVLKEFPLADLVNYIDWSPFFHTWELAGRYPAILKDKVVGEIKSEQMPAQAISDLTKGDKSLYLRYSFDYQGNPVPTVVSLTPGEDGKTTAQIDFAGGAYVMTGTATKKEKAK